MIENVLLWLVPVVILPASFLAYRFLPFRSLRYYGWNEIVDTGLFFLVNFIFADYFWNIVKVKNRRLVISLVIIGVGIFGAIHCNWIAAGPANAWKLWNPGAVSSYTLGQVQYAVKDRDLFRIIKPARILTLSQRLGKWPLEKQIHAYRTPEDFSRTIFNYKWSETDQGVRVDLGTAGYTLWTMGEGF
jgi:hypothetical protein